MLLRLKVFLLAMAVAGLAWAAPADYLEEINSDAVGAADSPFTGRYEGSTIVGQTSTVFDLSLIHI